jgi:hypothetical protein
MKCLINDSYHRKIAHSYITKHLSFQAIAALENHTQKVHSFKHPYLWTKCWLSASAHASIPNIWLAKICLRLIWDREFLFMNMSVSPSYSTMKSMAMNRTMWLSRQGEAFRRWWWVLGSGVGSTAPRGGLSLYESTKYSRKDDGGLFGHLRPALPLNSRQYTDNPHAYLRRTI